MEHHEIIIVGAGASGLMCGYLLGKQGRDVLILEKNQQPGKKLLATGNGRCNFTNRCMNKDCYYGEASFVEPVLERFDDRAAIRLFEEIGIYHRERDGYCYPYSGQASAVQELLILAARENGVHIVCDARVGAVRKKTDGYEVRVKSGDSYTCGSLILAAGGKANAALGGEGSGYKLCRSLGHQITAIYPGLTGLKAEGGQWKRLAGVRMQGAVSLYADSSFIRQERGEIQLVREGISGIPVFQLCRLAAAALDEGRRVTCRIDFFPEKGEGELVQWLGKNGTGKMAGLIHKKWKRELMSDEPDLKTLAHRLKSYPVIVCGTFGMERAQVSAGGVVTGEISPETMESRIHKHLYVLGELLDVDGICGGYNLHFAWATASLCAGAFDD